MTRSFMQGSYGDNYLASVTRDAAAATLAGARCAPVSIPGFRDLDAPAPLRAALVNRIGFGQRMHKSVRYSPRRGRRKPTLAALVFGLTFGLSVYLAYADDNDHEHALAALRSGEIVSLREMLGEVEQRFVGQVLQVELEKERENGRQFWIYEIKLIGPDGNVAKLQFDAKTKEVLKMKGRAQRRGSEP